MCIRDRHKISGNLIVNGFADGKPTSFTVDTGATVSIVRPDLVCNRHPLISSCTIQMCIRDSSCTLWKSFFTYWNLIFQTIENTCFSVFFYSLHVLFLNEVMFPMKSLSASQFSSTYC